MHFDVCASALFSQKVERLFETHSGIYNVINLDNVQNSIITFHETFSYWDVNNEKSA